VETRRTGGGGKPLEAFFPENAGGVYTVGGGAFFAAVDPRKERHIPPADDTSTSPNFFCGTSLLESVLGATGGLAALGGGDAEGGENA